MHADSEELRIYLRTVADTTGARQTQQALRGIQSQAMSIGLAGTGIYAAMNAVDAYARFLGESVDALREHQRITLQTSAVYATWATEVTNLDAAFKLSEKSGKEFQETIGRFAAPAVLSGLKAMGGAMEGITNALQGAARWTAEMGKEHPWLFQGAAGLPGIGPVVSQLGAAGESLKEEDRAAARRRQEQQMRRLREINELPRTDIAGEAQRLHFYQQVSVAVGEARQAQQRQLDLQREGVNLAAQEAQIRLSLLPATERMAELQRQMTEQQIRARRAAMPATEALEDLRYMQQRAELISKNRNVGVEQRIGARRELRAIGRALPGVELGALEAERGVTLVGRQAERLGMEQQLFEISTQRQLEQIQGQQLANQLLGQIAAQQTQAIELTINLSAETFQTEVYKQLIEAEKQAQGPTVIKLSGVRR